MSARENAEHPENANDAHRTVREPPPAQDDDSPLAFSLEGVRGPLVPAPLLTDLWEPGWNSISSITRFQEEVNGPLRGGPSGTRLFDSVDAAGDEGAGDGPATDGHDDAAGDGRAAARTAAFFAADLIPPLFAPREGEWLLVPLHHIYGSEPLSMHTPGVAERAPEPYVALSPDEAHAAGFVAGQRLTVSLPEGTRGLPLRLLDGLARGVAGLPVGLPDLPYAALPAFATLAAEQAGGGEHA